MNDRKYGYLKSTLRNDALFSSVTPTLFAVHIINQKLKFVEDLSVENRMLNVERQEERSA